MRCKIEAFVVFFLCVCSLPTSEQQYVANWSSLDTRPLPGWYDDSKIGIFLHWGLYSIPSYGTEWYVVEGDEKN